MSRGLQFLRREQEEDGSWFGRWGNNYVYGTWSVLSAFNAAGVDMESHYIQKAAKWLKFCQRPDGGWGEDCSSYYHHRRWYVSEEKPPPPSGRGENKHAFTDVLGVARSDGSR